LSFEIFGLYGRKIILVLKLGQSSLLAKPPGEMMIVCDEAHVVSVYCSKGRKSIPHDSE
jgi:hypothetical protein